MIAVCASLILLIAATISDVKCGKIINWITLPCLLIFILVAAYTTPSNCVSRSIAVCIWFLAGCVGISGWGDIKCCMALTMIIGWKDALFVYLGAQLCLIAWNLIISPKEVIFEIRYTVQNLLKKSIAIKQTKSKHIFAPYLLFSYLIQLLISTFTNGGLL